MMDSTPYNEILTKLGCENYPFSMTCPGKAEKLTVFADSYAELLSYMMTGQLNDSPVISAEQRHAFAVETVGKLREKYINKALGNLDEAQFDEQLAAVLSQQEISSDRSAWPAAYLLPHVLLATDLGAHSDSLRSSSGAILLIDPATDESMIKSLERVDMLRLKIDQASYEEAEFWDNRPRCEPWGNPLSDALCDMSWMDDTSWQDEL